MSTMTINGTPWAGPAGITVTELVSIWCPSPRGIAVARNGDVVPKSAWSDTELIPGDAIEIVTAAAGG
jgi:sulfur carrier protein